MGPPSRSTVPGRKLDNFHGLEPHKGRGRARESQGIRAGDSLTALEQAVSS